MPSNIPPVIKLHSTVTPIKNLKEKRLSDLFKVIIIVKKKKEFHFRLLDLKPQSYHSSLLYRYYR